MRKAVLLTTLMAFMMGALAVSSGFSFLFSSNAALAAEDNNVVVAIDVGHNANHIFDLGSIYDELENWGYTVKNITTFTSEALADVDIVLTFTPYRKANASYEFTTDELNAIKAWFDEGGKAIWVSSDSDYDDVEGKSAARVNVLLDKIGSHIFVEQASVESELNAGAPYRVRPGTYNLDDKYVKDNFYDNFSFSATTFFHGPAPLIGRYDNGTLTQIENNPDFYSQYDVYWVVKATNNDTYKSIIARGSNEGLPYQVHELNEQGDFVMMAVERYAGAKKSSKIVVTGEAIMTDYKNQFNTTDEYDNPSNNYQLVKNTINWMAKVEKKAAGIPGFEMYTVLMALTLVLVPVYIQKRKRTP